MIEIDKALAEIDTSAHNHHEIESAVLLFDPIWEAMTLRDQIQLIQMVVKRVDCDGETGRDALCLRELQNVALEPRWKVSGKCGKRKRSSHPPRPNCPQIGNSRTRTAFDFSKDNVVDGEELGGQCKAYHRAARLPPSFSIAITSH